MNIPKPLFDVIRFNFLYVDKFYFKQGWVYPESYVPYSMVRYILKGSAVFTIDGIDCTVHQNEVAYIPNDCMLKCYSLENDFEFISIRFVTTVQLNGGDYLEDFFHIPHVIAVPDAELLSYFQSVYENATSEKASRFFRIRGNLELIIAYLVEHSDKRGRDDTPQPKRDETDPSEEDPFSIDRISRRAKRSMSVQRDPRIQTVVDYLINHPAEQVNFTFLCEIAQVSPSTLRRLFKAHTGKTPGNFIKDIRIMAAARQLLATSKSISSIAYELGFKEQNYFSRVFKQVFGVSPSQYRMSSRV